MNSAIVLFLSSLADDVIELQAHFAAAEDKKVAEDEPEICIDFTVEQFGHCRSYWFQKFEDYQYADIQEGEWEVLSKGEVEKHENDCWETAGGYWVGVKRVLQELLGRWDWSRISARGDEILLARLEEGLARLAA
ncbi:hypothetical protein P154DRAFT_577612 [Amniculicola lignicola CBS 123094]|uniref:Uncharacterized protein n=1 Tax=Amniculicola lignicola CBS 123094 TaxID=1392246 RepID=A0A6A5WBE5_9PLEO|nr:hypothetical protein P154DRAFT_577612 [Amniculicola lignicola CBS 123094]